MSTITIQGSKVVVKASIDTRFSSATDYLMVQFAPVSMGMYRSDERKAFIAALQAADAELDVAALRGKKDEVPA
ncbi:MAG TPA: hypothetical protein VMV63_05560 [Acidithiobacillus sp.]|nr:hypothetical protein [Acidithiobacillus sp.]